MAENLEFIPTEDGAFTQTTFIPDDGAEPGPTEEVAEPSPKYPVGANGVVDLSALQLTNEDSIELFDSFLANKFGSEYIVAKLHLATNKNG